MPLCRSEPNTRTLPTILLALPPSKTADMAYLCVPQNQVLGFCRRFVPDIQVCATHGREDLVNATITLNAEKEEEQSCVPIWVVWVTLSPTYFTYITVKMPRILFCKRLVTASYTFHIHYTWHKLPFVLTCVVWVTFAHVWYNPVYAFTSTFWYLSSLLLIHLCCRWHVYWHQRKQHRRYPL